MISKPADMVVGQKICTQCRKKLQKWSPEVEEESRQLRSLPFKLKQALVRMTLAFYLSLVLQLQIQNSILTSDMELADFNTSLELLGESPIPKKKPAYRYLKAKV